jgi:hypothetical protein
MTDETVGILMQGTIKLATIVGGAVCIVLGYRLFIRGVTSGGANADFAAWNARVVVGKGGPGLLFGLFGVAIVMTGLLRSGEIRKDTDEIRTIEAPGSGGSTPGGVTSERIKSTVSIPVSGPKDGPMWRLNVCVHEEMKKRRLREGPQDAGTFDSKAGLADALNLCKQVEQERASAESAGSSGAPH